MKRRKLKKYIPYGSYCYTVIGKTDNGLKIKRCPFFKCIEKKVYEGEYNGKPYKEEAVLCKCTFCQVTSDEEPLLEDMVKICGIHENY